MRRVVGFDLLRGMAIALVMLHHAAPEQLPGAGVVGVVMFFALSGYLITGVLADEQAATGRVDFRRFYLRRARRLVPALLLLVAGLVVVTLTVDPLGDRGRLVKMVAVALTWTGNLPWAHPSQATFHLWTLATEEQFYLVWPAVLALGLARRRAGLALALGGSACATACVATVVWLHAVPDNAYSLPTSWAGCFVIGAAARLYRDRWTPPVGAVPTALAALGVLGVLPLRGHVLTYLAGGPAIALLTVVLLLAWRDWTEITGTLAPFLRPVVWLGTVSYAAYLWNYPLTLWLLPPPGSPHLHRATTLAAMLTLVMAAVSWYAVERPLQARSRRELVLPGVSG
jgi:peptidoglycan/LPS O-acetylase OafA/YrhL